MKSSQTLVAILLLSCGVIAAQPKPDSLFLRVVVPEADTVRVPYTRYRIAASTLPSAHAYINDKETKVYASGAFVGLFPLSYGANVLRLCVRDSLGDSLSRQFVFIRTEPPKTSPRDTLTIDSVMMEPARDLWLGKDDFVEVRFKGSPGYQATFRIEDVESGIPMRELSPREAGGLEGIYVGKYKVRDNDFSRGHAIEFKLKKSFWSSEKASSRGKVWIIPDSLPRVGVVVGRRPFLNAGLGTDRLGGAKLGYIQPGVLVEIAGKEGSQYRIRLSESMEGWLPEEFAQLLPFDTPLPRSLTGSITVSGSGTTDVVTLALSRKLPYLSEQHADPNEIIVDVFGATSNTNWITQQLSAEVIKSVRWSQVAMDQYRLVIELSENQQWGYDIGYDNGSTLRITVRRPPVISSPDSVLAGMIIALDAGHGGDNEGALGATGVLEKDVTLNIARHLQDSLRSRGATVVMTREGDFSVGQPERADKVLSSGARVLVSIHCNSTGETADPLLVQGTSTYYRHIGFRPLATIMYDHMVALGLQQFGVTGSFNFALNAPTQLPNVLVETAFLSNPEDEMLLLDDGFRKRIAGAVTDGLVEFVRKYALPRK
ncbi:MAG TPA: N-acetylmuramoyl-L-alanine amidase [Bacteroidota bacterium]|nr:N-acetylmuramoyl-L-alanine amidase [Bacteroidota bacterium]